MAASRLKAIEKEKKVIESRSVNSRKDFVNEEVLNKAGIVKYKVAEGNHFLAIIPPKDPEAFYGCRVSVHYRVGAAEDSYLCPLDMWREKCPICEERSRIQQLGGDAVDKEYIKKLYPSIRHLYFVVDMKNKEEQEKGLQLFEAGYKVNTGIMSVSKNKRTGELMDISDPAEGRIFAFERKGKGQFDTDYIAFSLEERDPLEQKWLDGVPDFKDVIVRPTYDEIMESFKGKDEHPKEDKDEAPFDTSPAKSVPVEEKKVETAPKTEASVQTKVEEPKAAKEEKPVAETAAPAASGSSIDAIRARLAARKAAMKS